MRHDAVTWMFVLALAGAGCGGGEGEAAGATEAAPEASAGGETVAADEAEADDGKDKEGAPDKVEGHKHGRDVAEKAGKRCDADPNAEPVVYKDEGEVADILVDKKQTVFDVAGIAVHFPPCMPVATGVITMAWEHEHRPTSTHVHPKFERHGPTLMLDTVVKAGTEHPIIVGRHMRRMPEQEGAQYVLAVEHSGECTGRFKKDKLEWGDCSHWKIYTTEFDEEMTEVITRIPETGGYRLQFGWMPNNWSPDAPEE